MINAKICLIQVVCIRKMRPDVETRHGTRRAGSVYIWLWHLYQLSTSRSWCQIPDIVHGFCDILDAHRRAAFPKMLTPQRLWNPFCSSNFISNIAEPMYCRLRTNSFPSSPECDRDDLTLDEKATSSISQICNSYHCSSKTGAVLTINIVFRALPNAVPMDPRGAVSPIHKL